MCSTNKGSAVRVFVVFGLSRWRVLKYVSRDLVLPIKSEITDFCVPSY